MLKHFGTMLVNRKQKVYLIWYSQEEEALYAELYRRIPSRRYYNPHPYINLFFATEVDSSETPIHSP